MNPLSCLATMYKSHVTHAGISPISTTVNNRCPIKNVNQNLIRIFPDFILI